MATSKSNTPALRPIIFDDEPFNVLASLQAVGGLRGVDDEKLGDNFSCFVLKTNLWYGLPSWDKGDPEKGRHPKPDFWTQILFVPTFAATGNVDDKLVNKVSDRTVCQLFKRGRHLQSFHAACKTTRNETKLDVLLDELQVEGLQAWQLVVWTPQFTPKTSKEGFSYSALKWWWNLPEGEKQLETQSRVIQMFKQFGVDPLELDYEVDAGLLNLDALKPEQKKQFKQLIAAENQPALGEVAKAFLALGQATQPEQHQLATTVEVMPA
jgi:hypothetical protein